MVLLKEHRVVNKSSLFSVQTSTTLFSPYKLGQTEKSVIGSVLNVRHPNLETDEVRHEFEINGASNVSF